MEKKSIEAVHERDLETLLRSFGLWDQMTKSQIRCSICGDSITLSSIGLIYPQDGAIMICCHKMACYEEVKAKTKEM